VVKLLNEVKAQIENIINIALERALSSNQLTLEEHPEINLEPPKSEAHGDIACPVALTLARQAKLPPREIAKTLIGNIDVENEPLIEKIEIGGPGFINFYLSNAWLYALLKGIQEQGCNYGKCDIGNGTRIQVEFVSANPTGPLNVVNGRAASVGDTIVNLLNAVGYKAEREYYINNAGGQAYALAKSIDARYHQLLGVEDYPFPENGYPGDYVIDLAQQIIDEYGERYKKASESERIEAFRKIGCEKIVEQQRKDLERFGVKYDAWVSERAMRDTGKPAEIISILNKKGFLYKSEGALWFKAAELGEDKDCVVVKSDGEYTYLTPDIAYHYNKFERGFDRVIDLWGPDHHAQMGRLKTAMKALGFEDGKLDILTVQQVNIIERGESVKMSKRKGKFFTLAQLMDNLAEAVDEQFAVDVARYFFLMRSTNAHLDFDINLAIQKADENPVFYVQYAHARICSIFKEMERRGIERLPINAVKLPLLTSDEEIKLMKKIADFPELVFGSATSLEPHRIPHYLQDIASLFHTFYNKHRVLDDAEPELTQARLVLVDSLRTVLSNGLKLLGITAPEEM